MQRATSWSCFGALLAVILFSGCGDGGNMNPDGGPTDRPHTMGGQSWTVLVYMVADNDLEPFALQDLTEMMTVGSGSGLNIVVQADRADGYSAQGVGGLNDWTDTKRLLVKNGSLEVVQEMGELDMADPATLSDFVSWGIKTYPADRTAVVFWDHGGGWSGFGVDEASGGKLLNLTQIDDGLKNGIGAGKPLALVGFDACLMATWEVAITLSPRAEYLLASEETEPGHGWDWSALQVISDNPGADPTQLGKSIIAGFKQQAITEKTADGITLSLIDLYRLGTLSKAMDKVIATFDNSAAIATAFGRGQQQGQKFGDSPDPAKALNLVDLADMVALTAKESTAVNMVAADLASALSAAVIDHTEGAAKAGGHGMAIYFPPSSTYYDQKYEALTGPTAWRAFLKSYFGGSTAVTGKPEFTNPNKVAASQFGTSGYTVEGTLKTGTAASIARTTMLTGAVTGPDTIVFVGEYEAAYDMTRVQGTWDLSALTLTQGSNVGFAYSTITQIAANKLELDILFVYQKSSTAQAQDCIRQLVFTFDNAGNVTLTSDAYYVSANGAVGELTPQAGATLTPVVKTLTISTGAESYAAGASTPFTTTNTATGATFDMALDFQKFTTGDKVAVILTAANAAGEGDAVAAVGTVP